MQNVHSEIVKNLTVSEMIFLEQHSKVLRGASISEIREGIIKKIDYHRNFTNEKYGEELGRIFKKIECIK